LNGSVYIKNPFTGKRKKETFRRATEEDPSPGGTEAMDVKVGGAIGKEARSRPEAGCRKQGARTQDPGTDYPLINTLTQNSRCTIVLEGLFNQMHRTQVKLLHVSVHYLS